jgi:prepilin-type N-terminal cleavage/methylation domain-containing protein
VIGRRIRPQAGFTLVELLVVLVLLGVVGGIVTSAIVTGMTNARTTTARTVALHDLEIALQRVGRELRAADPLYVTSGDGYARQVGAEVTRDRAVHIVTFTVVTEGGRQLLVQDTQSATFEAIANAPPGTAIEDLLSPQVRRQLVVDVDDDQVFTYYDRNGNRIDCDPQDEEKTKEECDLAYSDAYQLGIRLVRQVGDQRPLQAETRINVRNMRYRSSGS